MLIVYLCYMNRNSLSIASLVFILTIGMFLSGCENNDPEPPEEFEFSLKLNPHWENSELLLNQNYLNISGYHVSFDALKFYLSNISLIKNNGDEIELSDIEFFDLENDILLKKFSIPNGNYKGIKFGWGVPVELNGTDDENFDPTIYGSDHPLNLDNNMYWTWAAGYRFLIFDGRYDTTPSTNSDIPDPFSIHTGTDEVYREIENLSVPFTFDNESNLRLMINVDLSKSFYSENDTIDLSLPEDNQAHVTNIQLHHRLMDNIIAGTSYDIQ